MPPPFSPAAARPPAARRRPTRPRGAGPAPPRKRQRNERPSSPSGGGGKSARDGFTRSRRNELVLDVCPKSAGGRVLGCASASAPTRRWFCPVALRLCFFCFWTLRLGPCGSGVFAGRAGGYGFLEQRLGPLWVGGLQQGALCGCVGWFKVDLQTYSYQRFWNQQFG
jgi:hypothetical protein